MNKFMLELNDLFIEKYLLDILCEYYICFDGETYFCESDYEFHGNTECN